MLYREIFRKPQPAYGLANGDKFRAALRKAMVFGINNVAEYLYAISGQFEWDIGEDFPNLAPPYPLFWMEYKPPGLININGEIKKQRFKALGRVGALVESREGYDPKVLEGSSKIVDEIKWTICIALFCGYHSGAAMWVSNSFVSINPKGEVVKDIDGRPAWGKQLDPHFNESYTKIGHDSALPEAELFPILLAISFLHCKNVTIAQTGEIKRHKPRANREPAIKIHTLEIEPMKKVLRTEGQSEKTGIKQALHICRGHFKDFRQGPGLFGKFKDIYWWDSQVRGSSKYGEIRKDYNVNPPQESKPTR